MSELKVTTFSSKGRATRIQGIKTGKIHHLQSDNQLRAFLIFEWSDAIIDIKEGVKLEDLLEVIDGSENLRLDKFINKATEKTYDLFTNFLVTVKREDKEFLKAISIKNTSELKRKSTIEKMEIERRFWRSKGIEFYVITENELNRTVAENIMNFREVAFKGLIEDKNEKSEKLTKYIISNLDFPVNDVLKEFEMDFELIEGEGFFLLRYLLFTKALKIDMSKQIDISLKGKEIFQR